MLVLHEPGWIFRGTVPISEALWACLGAMSPRWVPMSPSSCDPTSALQRPQGPLERVSLLTHNPLPTAALELQGRQRDTMGAETLVFVVISGQPALVHKGGARGGDGRASA